MDGPTPIKIKYVFNDEYNPKYVNGAYGGVTPQGDLVLNFYFERLPIPNSVTHIINDDGTLGEITAIHPQESIVIRYIQNGVILNLNSARQLQMWLSEKIDQMEAGDNDGCGDD